MPRTARVAPGGMVFHVLNRSVDRKTLFHDATDFLVFEQMLVKAVEVVGIRLCAYCLMPNHWHMVLWPSRDGQMSRFMHRLTLTHTIRWKTRYDAVGHGHLYQNRFKSFPVQSDEHYLTVVRYVERNPLRANLVERAEDWPFSSLRRRVFGTEDILLSAGPVSLPLDWVERVNRPGTAAELEALRASANRGTPYGSDDWQMETARELALESSMRPRGRPQKSST